MEPTNRNTDGGPVRIQVFLDEEGALRLWSVRIEFQRALHEISFAECNLVSGALVPALSSHLRRVADLLRTGGRLERAGAMVDLESGLLSDMTARARFGESGFMEIDVVYTQFLGSLSCLFVRAGSARDPSARAREKIAVEALVEIAGPLLSVAMQAKEIAKDEEADLREQLEAISLRAEDMELSLHKLRRYLATLECGPAKGFAEPMRRRAGGADGLRSNQSLRLERSIKDAPKTANVLKFPKAD